VVELWFTILYFTLAMFAVLEGWDFGAGALQLIVAKTRAERRDVIAAIGPLWTWHEVWLVAAGGTFMLAFPRAMAVAFSGYYLALWLAIWSLMLRGVALEVGAHLADPLWQSFWSFVFVVANVLLALVFGVALGNVIRGVPLDQTGRFSLAFFTDFGVRGRVGILDWYSSSVALATLLLLSAHGATYLVMKTTGPVHTRSASAASRCWLAVALSFPVISLETWIVRPEMFRGIVARPLGWLALASLAVGVTLLLTGWRGRREVRAFVGSCVIIAGLLAALAVGVFPVLLRSTLSPELSLTAHQAASKNLGMALLWWPLGLALALGYSMLIAWQFRGKLRATAEPPGSP
jgi:cytochrome d ubiquinol oxidase subunit II